MEDTAEDIDPYSIKVPGLSEGPPVFEGPLDLLLHLIKENKVDIYDIPIALITRRYLEYIDIMKELNLEIASEFLVMASTLIYIKSRMLLPPDPDMEALPEEEDPRAGLVQRLLEYQAYKEASTTLREREDLWTNAFARPPIDTKELTTEPSELYLFDVNLFDLLGALKKIITRVPPEALMISRETLTIKDRISAIVEKIESDLTIKFEDIFSSDKTRLQVIVTFLALLEILKLGMVKVFQDKEFATIWIMRSQEDTQIQAESDVSGDKIDI
ncbi:MAG: segregation/condensation protein A [Nitrospirae bacterium]|nr:segregation/condensation protein A [Nitrospirota bacterium]